MKTTINKFELKKLKICKSIYKTFINAHGKNTVTFSQAFESNGWDDIWWLISEVQGELSKDQLKDLRLLGCDWALGCIVIFEEKYPYDNRPRLAIEASIKYANGEITKEALYSAESAADSAAKSAADSAAWAARSAAWAAAWAAADSVAESASESAARSAESAGLAAWAAVESAVLEYQKKDLMNLFLKWEK